VSTVTTLGSPKDRSCPSAASNVEPAGLNLTAFGVRNINCVSGLFATASADITGGGSGTTYLSGDPNVVTVDTNGVVAPRAMVTLSSRSPMPVDWPSPRSM